MKNTSGIEPLAFNVLVRPDKVEQKTAGGIFIPDQVNERDQFAQQRGVVVAVSPVAFSYETWPQGARLPQPGDRVVWAKYAGMQLTGRDSEIYRLIEDKQIAGFAAE